MRKIIIYNLLLITLVFLILPVVVLAQQPSPQPPGPQAAPQYCTIGNGKIKVPCPLFGAEGPGGQDKFGNLVTTILNIALLIVGSVAVAFLVYGGFRYITAVGNEEQNESAKKIIQQAILGLIIVVLAFAIINVIANALIGGRAGIF